MSYSVRMYLDSGAEAALMSMRGTLHQAGATPRIENATSLYINAINFDRAKVGSLRPVVKRIALRRLPVMVSLRELGIFTGEQTGLFVSVNGSTPLVNLREQVRSAVENYVERADDIDTSAWLPRVQLADLVDVAALPALMRSMHLPISASIVRMRVVNNDLRKTNERSCA